MHFLLQFFFSRGLHSLHGTRRKRHSGVRAMTSKPCSLHDDACGCRPTTIFMGYKENNSVDLDLFKTCK